MADFVKGLLADDLQAVLEECVPDAPRECLEYIAELGAMTLSEANVKALFPAQRFGPVALSAFAIAMYTTRVSPCELKRTALSDPFPQSTAAFCRLMSTFCKTKEEAECFDRWASYIYFKRCPPSECPYFCALRAKRLRLHLPDPSVIKRMCRWGTSLVSGWEDAFL